MTTDTATPHDTAGDADHDDDELELSEEELEAIAERELDAVMDGYDTYLDRAVDLFVESFYWWSPERIIERFKGIDLSQANEETEYEARFEIRDASVELVSKVTFTEREEWEPPQPGDDDYDEDEDYEAPEPEVWTEEFSEILVNFSHEGERGTLSRNEAEALIWDAFSYSDKTKRDELTRLSEAAVANLDTECRYLMWMEEVAELYSEDRWLAVLLHVAGNPLTPPSLLVTLYDSADERVALTARANRRDEVMEWLENQGMESAADIPEEWLGLIFG